MNLTDTTPIQQLKFSINHWNHLYSLQQAIQFNQQRTGRSLNIQGKILNHPLLGHHDTDVSIRFRQVAEQPDYPLEALEGDPPLHILGKIKLEQGQLSTEIDVDRAVFEELRRNLTEYGDIEGIHIVVTLGVLTDAKLWPEGQLFKLLQLDYAMKGDA